MKRFYILDRNAVSEIRKAQSGVRTIPANLSKLRSLDNKNSIVSCITSILEGNTRGPETSEEVRETILKDMAAISMFYKHAKTDVGFLQKNLDIASDALHGNEGKEIDWGNYIDVIHKAQKELYQPIAKKDRYKYAEDFLKFCCEKNVNRGHAIVLCILGVLYRNENAIKVLKARKVATKHDAYNACSDLIIFSRKCRIQNMVGNKGIVKFITFDKALEKLFSYIKVNHGARLEYDDSSGFQITQTFKNDLFNRDGAEASDDDIEKIIYLIRK